MRLRKTSLAVGTILSALTASSAISGASAGRYGDYVGIIDFGFSYGTLRAPQPNQSLPGATSRPSNRDMRGAPSMGGGGMRGPGGSRMNGDMGRR